MPAFRLATRKPDLHLLHYWTGTQTGLYPCYAIMLCFVDEKLQKLQSGWGSAPDPDGGAYSAPPYPLAGREGATPPPAPTPALNPFHLIAFPNPPVSRPAYGPGRQVCSPVRSVRHPSLQTRRQGLPNVFIPRHKMEVILLGVCVYGILLKLYLLFQLFQNNDVKLATSIIGRNGAVNMHRTIASESIWCKSVSVRYVTLICIKSCYYRIKSSYF